MGRLAKVDKKLLPKKRSDTKPIVRQKFEDTDALVLERLRDFIPKKEIVKELMEKYGMSVRNAEYRVRALYKRTEKASEVALQNLRVIQLNRLEAIMERAVQRNDFKSAVSAADLINKMYGLYDNKVKVEITKDVIQFKFAEQPVEVQDVVQYEEINEDEIEEVDE